MKTFQFEAGRLLWGLVRDLVSEARFHGKQLELWESSGWLSRRFIFKGDEETIKIVERVIRSLETPTKIEEVGKAS